MTRDPRRLLAALLFVASFSAAASPLRPFGLDRPAEAFDPAPALHLGEVTLGGPARLDLSDVPTEEPPPATIPPHRLFDGRTTRFTLGFTAATLTAGYLSWWHDSRGTFTFANERWFQEDSYTGGADKVSHFVVSYNAEWGLEAAYRKLGHPESEARWLATGVVAALGVLVEVGDGFTFYGASWEDAVSNLAGALLSSQVGRLGLRDTIGVRFGRVKALIPDPCCRAGLNESSDYSREIYSLDVKLAGLLPRLGLKKSGPARFLLLSLTYGTKGYRFSWTDRYERNLGMDVGLNLPEILRAIGVRDDTWWGAPLLAALSMFRIPYTTFGFRYDFNHRKWSGWDTGDHFHPGSVIYD